MPATSDPVNVLVVLTDQQRWDALGCAGNPDVQTPALDELAKEAVHFPLAFCTHPVCTPSRYSILSGLYLHQHGGMSNRSTLSPGLPTFPRLLRQAGYRTSAVGKMHFTPTYLDVGFDRLELAEQDGDGRLDDDYHRDLRAHGLVDAVDVIDQRREFRSRATPTYWESFGAQPTNLPERWYSTNWIGDRAAEHLGGWGEGANALMVGFIKPHHPFDVPERWVERYDAGSVRLRPGWTERVPEHDVAYARGYFSNEALTEKTLRQAMVRYYASITQIDAEVGRMVAILKEKGLYDNTLIIFTADHGDYLGFHHMLLKGGYPYEPLARVPLLIKFPGGSGGGTKASVMASGVDLAPTILRQAGIEPAPGMSGLDLADPESTRDVVFVQGRPGAYLARSASHALIWCQDDTKSLLFDLGDDPNQLRNRFDDPAAHKVREQLRAAIARWQLFDAPRPAYADRSAVTISQPNVLTGEGHRQGMLDFFDQEVKKLSPGGP